MSQPQSSGRPRPHANTTPHTPKCEEPVTLLHPLDALMGWVNWTHPITMRVSQSERQIGLERASLETLLDIHEETGGVRAVDQAMVIGQ